MQQINDRFTPSLAPMRNLLDRFSLARDWIESHQIRVDASRFDEYKRVIERGIASGSLDLTSEDMPLFQWACVELHDLLDIYDNLQAHKHPQFLASLKKLVKGPSLLQSETPDNASIHGRNFTFELYTASRLARMGFDVYFDGISDVRFETDSASVHVECKRAIGVDNLDSLIDKGFSQIRKRCDKESKKFECGIVSLSLSRYVFQILSDQGPLVCTQEQIQNEMRRLLGTWGQYFVPNFSRNLPTGVGILVHYKLPFWSTDNGCLTMLNRFFMYELAKASDRGYEVLRTFREKALTDKL